MTAFAVLYGGWLPLPLIQRTSRHVIGTLITMGAFYVLFYVTKTLVPVQWVREYLDAIHIWTMLFLAALLAVEISVSFVKDVWKSLKDENHEA